MRRFLAAIFVVFVVATSIAPAQEAPTYTRKEDVIYGRKFGTALTMDVFTPKENANGAGIISCVSGGWFSDHAAISPGMFKEFLKATPGAYRLFAYLRDRHGGAAVGNVPLLVKGETNPGNGR